MYDTYVRNDNVNALMVYLKQPDYSMDQMHTKQVCISPQKKKKF